MSDTRGSATRGSAVIAEEGAELLVARPRVGAAELDELAGEGAVEEHVREEIGLAPGLGLGEALDEPTGEAGGAAGKRGGSDEVGGDGPDVLGGADEQRPHRWQHRDRRIDSRRRNLRNP